MHDPSDHDICIARSRMKKSAPQGKHLERSWFICSSLSLSAAISGVNEVISSVFLLEHRPCRFFWRWDDWGLIGFLWTCHFLNDVFWWAVDKSWVNSDAAWLPLFDHSMNDGLTPLNEVWRYARIVFMIMREHDDLCSLSKEMIRLESCPAWWWWWWWSSSLIKWSTWPNWPARLWPSWPVLLRCRKWWNRNDQDMKQNRTKIWMGFPRFELSTVFRLTEDNDD